MIRSVHIEGYRGLSEFEMRKLGRVNLLVGKNNCGKTSVLEALYFLCSSGDPYALWQLCSRRGERFIDERELRYGGEREIDVSHLFTGHELIPGQKISIVAKNQSPERFVAVTVGEPSNSEPSAADPPLPPGSGGLPSPRLALHLKASPPAPVRAIPLSRRGGLSIDALETPNRRPARWNWRSAGNIHYISTDSLDGDALIQLWDKIQLTPNEALVLQALRFVDPTIEQVRATGSGRFYGARGGFIIKRSNELLPFPLGSLGDGAWRMLAMAIAVTQCANGFLFVDEIDTGLHYTVMADMWRLIESASKEFNVQVFATTHSYDCVYSLSSICQSDVVEDSEVSIQRLEANRTFAVPFSEAEIKVAAERHIEVR